MLPLFIQKKVANAVSHWVQQRKTDGAISPYLQGIYAPVESESTWHDLTVIGQIPTALNGIFARNGSNPIDVINPATYHWFSGDGMVHGVRIKEGKACWYRNRYVGADRTQKSLERKRLPGVRNGIVDVVNTSVFGHAGKLWALVEAGASPIELNHELESIRHGLFNEKRPLPFTAHPHLDPNTGHLHAISYDAMQRDRAYYQVIDAQGNLVHLAQFRVKSGPMMHDCALSTKHVLMLDLPVTFSFKSILRGATMPYEWNPKHPARVGIVPLMGKRVRWLNVEPCYVFHTGNAQDLPNGDIIMDAVVHDKMFDNSIHGPTANTTTLERWTLPANGDTVKRDVLAKQYQEFPRFDTRLTGQNYRYLYTMGVNPDAPTSSVPLLRFDLQQQRYTQHTFDKHRITGEATFVPRSINGKEDDGWLMSFVYNTLTDKGEIVILNADDLAGEPQAIIKLPVRVPMGFHCNWINYAA